MPIRLKPKVVDLENDPSNIAGRLYDAIDMALYDINTPETTRKERLSAVTAIGRICVILKGLNKDDPEPEVKIVEPIIEYGTKVRRYEKLFTSKNAASERKIRRRVQPHLLAAADLDDGDDGGNGLEDDDD